MKFLKQTLSLMTIFALTLTINMLFAATDTTPGKTAKPIQHVICSGPGCLRLLTYIQGQDKIVAVDSMETKGARIDARPYAIANPQFKKYPVFGEFRGHDNLELIAGLIPQPQIIFKTFIGRNRNTANLEAKTGIPVCSLNYGNLTYGRGDLTSSLLTMGKVMNKNKRAKAVVAYFQSLQDDLKERTLGINPQVKKSCYLGGVAMKGPHGLQSTEPAFAPFILTNASNVASGLVKKLAISHATVSREQIVFWDPDVIFLDASTMQMGGKTNALKQLKNDPAYKNLSAVTKGDVYVLFPYNSYQQNFESAFANAYYVGKILYPERFKDIDPLDKGEEISTFLNGAPAFKILKKQYNGLPFSKIQILR